MRPSQLISLYRLESFGINRSQLQKGPFESLILLIMIDDVLYGCLLEIAAFIYSLLGESRSNDIQFTKMPATVAIIAQAAFLTMMHEVIISQMFRSLSEEPIFPFTLFTIVFQVMSMRGLVEGRFADGRLC